MKSFKKNVKYPNYSCIINTCLFHFPRRPGYNPMLSHTKDSKNGT